MQGKRTNITKIAIEKILKYGLSSFIFAITVLIALIIINYIAAVKAPEIDMNKSKINTLSDSTVKLLKDLNFDVTIKAFYPDDSQRNIKALLEKYKNKSDKIKIEFIDPLKNPVVAEEYDVTIPKTLIFVAGKKTTRINPPIPGKSHDERSITIAIFRLLTDQNKTIYFTTGHGEMSIVDKKSAGLSLLNEKLAEQNYMLETVNLLDTGKVPEKCSVLVVAGCTVPFTESEVNAVEEYLHNQGSLILMIGPGVKHNLDRIGILNGVKFGDDYVYETSKSQTTDFGGPLYPLCSSSGPSDITAKLSNQSFLMPFVRSVTQITPMTKSVSAPIISSSEDSWAETDIESAKTVNTNVKPIRNDNEMKGPIPVELVTEREFNLPDSIATRNNPTFKVRNAFFGNATFVSNAFVNNFPSNMDLFLNTVNWITRNEKIIEITPHNYKSTPIELRFSERRMLSWLTLVVFPASILLVGIIVWYRRR